MSDPKIAGKSPIVDYSDSGTYFWCSCGESANQPFCDGSHKGTGFSPVKVEIESEKLCAWCTCKRTRNAPFCDGSHGSL